MLLLLVELLSVRPSAVADEPFEWRGALVRFDSSLKATLLEVDVALSPPSRSFIDDDTTEEWRRLLDEAAVFAARALLLFMICSAFSSCDDEAPSLPSGCEDPSVLLKSKMARSGRSLPAVSVEESLIALVFLRDDAAEVELDRRSFIALADFVGFSSASFGS